MGLEKRIAELRIVPSFRAFIYWLVGSFIGAMKQTNESG
jgi:hypothetical protein